jgi:DNA primase
VSESIRFFELGGRRLTLTNVDKVLWPDDGFTKLDVIQYYDVYPEDFHIRNAAQRLRTIGDPLTDFRLSSQKLPVVGDSRRQRRNGEEWHET